MKKSIFALAGRSILAVTLAALLMLSGCRADDSVPTETEPMVFSTGVDVGYDVIMCVDESTSIGNDERKKRNSAATVLTQTMTDDCSLGVLFFASTVDNESVEEMRALSLKENRDHLLGLFHPETGRMEADDSGTNLYNALSRAFEMLGVSERGKAVILFTDGINYVSNGRGSIDKTKTGKEDEKTRNLVEAARTMDGGKPIPIYVVYLDNDYQPGKTGEKNLEAEKHVDWLVDTFGNGNEGAVKVDMVSNPDASGWNDLRWSDPSHNKVIIVNQADALSDVFNKIFYKIKNVSFKTISATPDEEGNALVSFNVPDFGISRIQLVASSSDAFSVGDFLSVDTSHIYEVPDGKLSAETSHLLNIVPDENSAVAGRLESGRWQTTLNGSKPITGSVALFADFSTVITYEAADLSNGKVGCCQDFSVSIGLADSNSQPISIPSGLHGSIVFAGSGNTEPTVYPLTNSDNTLRCEGLNFRNPGRYRYSIVLEYDQMNYTVDAWMDVEDKTPVLASTERSMRYTDKDVLEGGYLDLGPVSDFVYDAHDGELLSITMSEPCLVCTYEELYGGTAPANVVSSADAVSCADEVSSADVVLSAADAGTSSIGAAERHIFVKAGKPHKFDAQVLAVDSSGNSLSGSIRMNIAPSIIKQVLLWGAVSLVTAALAVLAALKLIDFFRSRRALEREPRAYNAMVSCKDNSETLCCTISVNEKLFDSSSAVVDLSKLRLFSTSSSDSQTLDDVHGLVLCLSGDRCYLAVDPIRLALSSIKSGKLLTIFNRSFVYHEDSYGDITTVRTSSVDLQFDTTYVIEREGRSLRVIVCEDDNWSAMLCSNIFPEA